ncbi:uncharacterized protein LOC6557299 isoform X2 [Drosophila grimshawi]|uniref:GH15910 n=1 Tax=Drosophila grimshawi TaxID=7222 RepID=B4J0Z1_DROGR|nr:uncharacterized protein LOC6557299 isoform X2 [Drosophila grimshawi]EDV95812.1 GH15910 [Drosophila grimshawi]
MLLDVIIWLPTLFTYLVFLLILIILFFIVVYVSHKIYISIYDNLPLPAAPRSQSSLNLPRDHGLGQNLGQQLSARSVWIQNRSQIHESSVVRITLTLEPCYLVSVELDFCSNSGQRAISFMCNCSANRPCADRGVHDSNSPRVIKYYDQLFSVPRLKMMMRCTRPNNMRLVLNDVGNDMIVARCTDSATLCHLPMRRLSSDFEH